MRNSCVFFKYLCGLFVLDKRGKIWRLQGLHEFQDQRSSSLGEHLHVPPNFIYYIHVIYNMYVRKYFILYNSDFKETILLQWGMSILCKASSSDSVVRGFTPFEFALTRSWLKKFKVTCSFQFTRFEFTHCQYGRENKNLVKNCPDTVVVLVFFFC